MLSSALRYLWCPHCGGDLHAADGSVRCEAGHAFDVAKQGYVSLLPGSARVHTADTPAMVAAREAFLEAGHYGPIADALAAEVAGATSGLDGCVVDVGAGTGYYLARALEAATHLDGLALDVAKPALRRAARAHPRAAAAACDAWGPLPVRTGAAAAALSVFAPRHGGELRRILQPGGTLIVVTPTDRHLAELIGALDLLHVDPDKDARLGEQLSAHFEPSGARTVEWRMALGHDDIGHLVRMGPSARHTDDDVLARRIAALPDPCGVTASVTVSTHHPR